MSNDAGKPIGAVVSLLRQEFPGLTDSKIRFLEDRRLIAPARTDSGYRSFSPHDIEVLRWILACQRDRYLPLNVIGERIDRGEHLADIWGPASDGPASDGPASDDLPLSDGAVSEGAACGESLLEHLRAGDADAATGASPLAADERQRTDGRADAQMHASATRRERPETSGPAAAVGVEAAAGTTAACDAGDAVAGTAGSVTQRYSIEDLCQHSGLTPAEIEQLIAFGMLPSAEAFAVSDLDADGAAADPRRSPVARSDRLGPSVPDEASGARPDAPSPGLPSPDAPSPGLPSPDAPSPSLPSPDAPSPGSRGVGAAASGAWTASATSATSAVALDLPCYGPDALLVARIAREFAAYGLGARHLRLIRNAAYRDASLFAQAIQPLRPGSGPDADADVRRALSRLMHLAERLRERLLSEALQDYFPAD